MGPKSINFIRRLIIGNKPQKFDLLGGWKFAINAEFQMPDRP